MLCLQICVTSISNKKRGQHFNIRSGGGCAPMQRFTLKEIHNHPDVLRSQSLAGEHKVSDPSALRRPLTHRQQHRAPSPPPVLDGWN